MLSSALAEQLGTHGNGVGKPSKGFDRRKGRNNRID